MADKGRLAALEARLADMDAQLALVSGELLGFRFAFIRLIALAQINSDDFELARQMAFAQATDAIELDEIHTDEAQVVLATVRKVFEIAAEARRRDTSENAPNAP